MPTSPRRPQPLEFVELGESLMSALLEPNMDKRRETLDAWLESAVPVLQAAVPDALRAYIKWVTEGTWTEEGWMGRRNKWSNTLFRLVMEMRVEGRGPRNEPQKSPKSNAQDDGSDNSGKQHGRSPNDDRSDSMNSNNPAHQATMDNRSNQLNPSHSAYHSSRGHR